MHVINVVSCAPDETFGRGAFDSRVFDLTERLGAAIIGASVWEMRAGAKQGPYHYHDGVEEWLYVVSGAPILRDPDGERVLEPGELIAFAAGPAGAHTTHGPGRIVIFSAGARGWGEAFLSVYPDSDKIAAKPRVIFRRADAIESWRGEPSDARAPRSGEGPPGPSSRAVNLVTTVLERSERGRPRDGGSVRQATLGGQLGAETWSATLYELWPGEASAPYHYEWCREKWALIVSGAVTLRHAEGRTTLGAGDICCFPEGPAGVHQLRNDGAEPVRLIVFSTRTDQPMSAFYPDEDTVAIRISEHEGFLFRQSDRIEDYWDGEPGAT